MIAQDEDALICDFAETYHVFNLYCLPVKTAATLAAGLKSDSRSVMIAGGVNAPPMMIMTARILDALHLLIWFKTKDGQKNRNRPKSVADAMINTKKENETIGFTSSAEFEAARKKLIEAARHGN